MEIAIWVISVLLAGVFGFVGAGKLAMDRSAFRSSVGAAARWTNHVTETQFRVIGFFELLGAMGLILPRISGVAEFLAPYAAFGLAVIMAVGLLLHWKIRDDQVAMVMPSILLSLCLLLVMLYTLPGY